MQRLSTSTSTVEPVLNHAAAEKARLVNAARSSLLTSGTCVTIEMVAEATGRTPEATRQWLRRHRNAGRLVTVNHEGTVLVPTFQLDDAFGLNETAAEIVGRLTSQGMSSWSIWDWFSTPNTWLDGCSPAEVLTIGGDEAVRRAAHGLFQT